MFKNIVMIAAAGLIGFWLVSSGTISLAGDKAPEESAAPVGGPPPAMPVSVAEVQGSEITEWREFSGRLRAVEDVAVRPRVSGTIEQVHFTEGDIVEAGAKLFTLDLRPYQAAVAQAEAMMAAAEARNTLAASEGKRAKTLFDEKAYSRREFDEKNNAAIEAAANVRAAKAALDLARLDLEYAQIAAPVAGRVGRPDITVGNIVQAGQSVLTTIQSVDPVYADFDIDELTYLKLLKAIRADNRAGDMPVYMALADEDDFSREGKIRSFDNRLQGDSGTLRVRAEFANPDGLLTPGLFARIRLGSAEKTDAVLINDAAIGTDQNRKFVYTVDENGAVNYRPVTLGPLHDDLRVIQSGLQPGEKIVVNGLMRVHPGMTVMPMMVDMKTLQGDAPPADAAMQAPQQ